MLELVYFYDVLRGLAAFVRWAETCGAALSVTVVEAVLSISFRATPTV